ncbi:Protein-lysine N-methyltransferase efm5 [Xanthoria parietina]
MTMLDGASRELPADTLALLGDFYSERAQKEKHLEDLKAQTDDDRLQTPLSMTMFTEDWNSSQFWVNGPILYETSHLDALSTVMRRPSFLLSSSSRALRKILESQLSPPLASLSSSRIYW